MQRKYKDIATDDMISFLKVLDVAFDDIRIDGNSIRFKDSGLAQTAFDAFSELMPDYFSRDDYRHIKETGEVGTVELINIKLELQP